MRHIFLVTAMLAVIALLATAALATDYSSHFEGGRLKVGTYHVSVYYDHDNNPETPMILRENGEWIVELKGECLSWFGMLYRFVSGGPPSTYTSCLVPGQKLVIEADGTWYLREGATLIAFGTWHP